MEGEKPGQTLQATALVHEAYLRLVDVDEPQQWNGRGHFFAAAAEAMRRIVVESARRRKQIKRGGDVEREALDASQLLAPEVTGDLLDLDAALDKLEREDPQSAQLVKLRYFAGLTIPQAALALNISEASAERYWAYARAWLHGELNPLPNERKNPPG